MFLGFVLFFFSMRYTTYAVPNVSCTIINLEYIDCNWNENGFPAFNYTFYSRQKKNTDYRECPTYLQERAHTVGCRLPYKNGDKFLPLFNYLSLDNSSETVQKFDLRHQVKLNPPHNLSVQMQGKSELWLHWNISTPSPCVESQVAYRKNTDQEEKMTGALTSKSFSLPFPSKNNRYTFRVRTRIMESCFQSNWSVWSTPVHWGQIKQGNSTSPDVSCTIINLEYIDCNWNETGFPAFNYTFYSRQKKNTDYRECPTYLQERAHTVGCRLPYKNGDKFLPLFTYLSLDNSSETVQKFDLRHQVKLNPPHNLSVQMQGKSELWLHWNISTPNPCVESQVAYRKNTDQEEKMTGALTSKSFSLPFPSKNNRYIFRVRTRIMESCFQSNWSVWSTPVHWGQIKQGNRTSTEPNHENSMYWLPFMLAVVCCVIVVAVLALVFQHERLRVILIPVVPNPSKTLEELLYRYNGNVEEWLHISKDFVQGFNPNFSEPACPVREYSLVSHMSISSSEDSFPVLLDESDSLNTSCSTSDCDIASSPDDPPRGLV